MGRMYDSREAVAVLSATPCFAGLDVDALDLMAGGAARLEFAAGQVVFLEDEPCAGLYIVQQGRLKSIKISDAGREQILRFVEAGDVFNEVGVLAGITNRITVVAVQSSTLWVIRRETIQQLLQDHPRFASLVTQNLAQRVLHLVSLVEDLSLRSVQERLTRFLAEHAGNRTVERRHWSTQAELAALLGTVPDVLSRALRDLVDQGIIRVGRQAIEILDMDRLRSIAMLVD
jgi:CRP-like cAMP-binding protein